MLDSLETSQLIFVILGAFMIGLTKGGIIGLSNITVAIYAMLFPSKLSVGIILPLLIAADVVALYFFRKHAVWKYIKLAAPWTLCGVVAGWLMLDRLDNQLISKVIGGILISLTVVHLYRKFRLTKSTEISHIPHTWWFAGMIGFLAGFTSMIANGAGPIMMIFFLAVGLPKMAFLGTSAWFFFILNLVKLPFHWSIETITFDTLLIDLKLAPIAMIGVVAGRYLVGFIPQKTFEFLAIGLTVLASIRLLV